MPNKRLTTISAVLASLSLALPAPGFASTKERAPGASALRGQQSGENTAGGALERRLRRVLGGPPFSQRRQTAGREEDWKEAVSRTMTVLPGEDITAYWLTRLYPQLEPVRQQLIALAPPETREALDFAGDKVFFRTEATPLHDQSETVRTVMGLDGGDSRSCAVQIAPGQLLIARGTGNGQRRFPIQTRVSSEAAYWFWYGESLDPALEAMVNVLQLQRIALAAEPEEGPLAILNPARFVDMKQIPHDGRLVPRIDYFVEMSRNPDEVSPPMRIADFLDGVFTSLKKEGILRGLFVPIPDDWRAWGIEGAVDQMFARNPLVQVQLIGPTDIRASLIERLLPPVADPALANLFSAFGETYVPPVVDQEQKRQLTSGQYGRLVYAANREACERIMVKAGRQLGRLVGTTAGVGADIVRQISEKDIAVAWANDWDDAWIPRPDTTRLNLTTVERATLMINEAYRALDQLSEFLTGREVWDVARREFDAASWRSYGAVQRAIINNPQQDILQPEYVAEYRVWRDRPEPRAFIPPGGAGQEEAETMTPEEFTRRFRVDAPENATSVTVTRLGPLLENIRLYADPALMDMLQQMLTEGESRLPAGVKASVLPAPDSAELLEKPGALFWDTMTGARFTQTVLPEALLSPGQVPQLESLLLFALRGPGAKLEPFVSLLLFRDLNDNLCVAFFA